MLTPVRNIAFDANTHNHSDEFTFDSEYSSETCFILHVRRMDALHGWGQDLLVKITIGDKMFHCRVGSSEHNTKTLNIDVSQYNIKLEQLDLDYSQRIPKIIHQTSKADMPHLKQNTVEALKQKNPEYEHRFYDDDAARNYIENNIDVLHPDTLKAFDMLIPGAYKADIFRLCVLYIDGGVYVDCKGINMLPFREVIKPDDELILTKDRPNAAIFNTIMFSVPRNDVIKCFLDESCKMVLRRDKGDNSLDITGPIRLGKILNKILGRDNQDFELITYQGNIRFGLYLDPHGDPRCVRDVHHHVVLITHYKGYHQEYQGTPYGHLYHSNKIFR